MQPKFLTQHEHDEQIWAAAAFQALEDRPMSYHIVTYGCQMNAHDSETMSGMLERMGMKEAEDRKKRRSGDFQHLLRS